MSSEAQGEEATVDIEQWLREWREINAHIARIENDCKEKQQILDDPDYTYEPARIKFNELLQVQQNRLSTKHEELTMHLGHIQGKGDLSPQMLMDALKYMNYMNYMNEHLIEFTTTEWANLKDVNRACHRQIKEMTDTEWCDVIILKSETLYSHNEKRRVIDWKGNMFQGNVVADAEWTQDKGKEAAWNSKIKKLLKPGECHTSDTSQLTLDKNGRFRKLWPLIMKGAK